MNINSNFGTKPKSGFTDDIKINEEKTKPISKKSASLADDKLDKYFINFISPIVSVDIPNHYFINKFAGADKVMKDQIKHVISLGGKKIKPNKVPIALTENANTLLYNKITDTTKKERFDATLEFYGIMNNREFVKKYPYQNHNMGSSVNGIRIICFKEDYDIDIILLDVHHLLASDVEIEGNYNIKFSVCKSCISTLV